MTVRTTSETVTFRHPFNLTGTDAACGNLYGGDRRGAATALVDAGLQADCYLDAAGANHRYGSDPDCGN